MTIKWRIEWRIRYKDGAVFDNLQGEPWEAPRLKVQIITQISDETGRYNQTQSDYYVWRDGRWYGCDLFHVWEYLFVDVRDHPPAVLAGYTIDTPAYLAILRDAEADPDFPARSAVHRSERSK